MNPPSTKSSVTRKYMLHQMPPNPHLKCLFGVNQYKRKIPCVLELLDFIKKSSKLTFPDLLTCHFSVS